jgi:hypothetical protein
MLASHWKALSRLFLRSRPRRLARRPVRSMPGVEPLEDRLAPATYKVTLGGDAGAKDMGDPTGLSGDLRYVVEEANKTAAADDVQFLLPVAQLQIDLSPTSAYSYQQSSDDQRIYAGRRQS